MIHAEVNEDFSSDTWFVGRKKEFLSLLLLGSDWVFWVFEKSFAISSCHSGGFRLDHRRRCLFGA